MKSFRFGFLFLISCLFFSSLVHSFEKIETKEKLMEILKNDEYIPGMEIWLKKPVKLLDEYGKLPGLSKLTFVDADIILKDGFANGSFQPKGVIIFVKDGEGNRKKLHLTTRTYYTTNFKGVPSLLEAEMYLSKEDLSKKTKKWNKKVLESIRNQSVQIGMTAEQVRMSFGSPTRINETSGEWGNHEQWVYGEFPGAMYLYMKNGRLTSVQKSQ